jgi:hypothetical protein
MYAVNVKYLTHIYFFIKIIIYKIKIPSCTYNLMLKLNVIFHKVMYIQMSSDTSYDKIKHLVEIEDDIFAVFTINSRGILI